jgi:hypothetical protein
VDCLEEEEETERETEREEWEEVQPIDQEQAEAVQAEGEQLHVMFQ